MTFVLFSVILKYMWDFIDIEDDTWYRWRLNGAEAYLCRTGNEWLSIFTSCRFTELDEKADGPEKSDPPVAAPFTVTLARPERVALRPYMPGRPFLVESRNDVQIHTGFEAEFGLSLPVEFRFVLESGQILAHSMPVVLSNTWFGDKTGGVLCYLLPAVLGSLSWNPDDGGSIHRNRVKAYSSFVHCKLLVRNGNRTPFVLKQIAVYSELLSIYDCDRTLCSESIMIDGMSDGGLRMSVGALPGSPSRKLLTPASVGQGELFIRRGMNFLRAITGM